MDWHKLQQTLFNIEPTNPAEDFKKLVGGASGKNVTEVNNVNYIAESVDVAPGSLELDRDYSVADFAKLAGVTLTEGKQKDGDYARGSDPMPKAEPGRKKHPLKDKLVGEGPLDSFKKGLRNDPDGWMNPNFAQNKLKGMLSGDNAPAPTKPQTKKPVNTQRMKAAFGVTDPAFVTAVKKAKEPGDQQLSMKEMQALAKAFSNMLNMNAKDIQKNLNYLRTQASTESIDSDVQETIKERLYRELRNKGI